MTKVTTQDLTADDLYLFNEGTHGRLAEKLGAHPAPTATSFAVWAPNAERVSVIGDFNGWDTGCRSARAGRILRRSGRAYRGSARRPAPTSSTSARATAGYRVDKADPFAFRAETPPKTGSIVWDLDATTGATREWMADRAPSATRCRRRCRSTRSTSARGGADPTSGWLGYRDLAPQLADTCSTSASPTSSCCPVMEHPFYGSWGYQTTGLLRADGPLRHAAGSHVPGRSPAPARASA